MNLTGSRSFPTIQDIRTQILLFFPLIQQKQRHQDNQRHYYRKNQGFEDEISQIKLNADGGWIRQNTGRR